MEGIIFFGCCPALRSREGSHTNQFAEENVTNAVGKEKLSGFFSYAHLDAEADAPLFDFFCKHLESRVNTRLLNASFKIWRDVEKLRIGDRWTDEINRQLKCSNVLIIMLSPKWLESANCIKEFKSFVENVESNSENVSFVATIVIRGLDNQSQHFSDSQKDLIKSINDRQYLKVDAVNFASSSKGVKLRVVDKIADDIEGMIERWRASQGASMTLSMPIYKKNNQLEFDPKAHDFAKVDPITEAEIVIENEPGSQDGNVFAYIDCIPRMYIQTASIRVEFSIRRIFLRIDDAGSNVLEKIDELRATASGKEYAYYIQERGCKSSINICIDPKPGGRSLAETPLPPAPNENRLSRVAIIQSSADIRNISAKVAVRLNAESLFVYSADPNQRVSAGTIGKIAAIINVAVDRQVLVDDDIIEKNAIVRERSK